MGLKLNNPTSPQYSLLPLPFCWLITQGKACVGHLSYTATKLTIAPRTSQGALGYCWEEQSYNEPLSAVTSS